MAKVIQIKNEEVLKEIIEGNAVYMLIKLREDTMLEEIIEAEAFVKLEQEIIEDESPEEPEQKQNEDEAMQEEQEKPAKGKKAKTVERSNAVDHGKIVACYRAGRSIAWIADEIGCTYQTVINHLKKEGLYKK